MNINKKVEGRKEQEKKKRKEIFPSSSLKIFWIPENIGRILLSYQNIQPQPTNQPIIPSYLHI